VATAAIGDTTTADNGGDWIGSDGTRRRGVVIFIRDHGHVCGSRRSELTNYLGVNPGGILGAAGLLVDHSLPDGQTAKSCIIAMVMMYPLMDGLSVKQAH